MVGAVHCKLVGRNVAPKVRYGGVRYPTAIILRVQCDTERAYSYDDYVALKRCDTGRRL